MTANPLGRINVATPGTLVPLSADLTVRVSKIFFQAIPGLTGKAYIGTNGMVRATLVKVMRVLAPNPSSGFSESFFLESGGDSDVLNLAEYYLDMDVAGEGLLVTYWTE
jgi:hypothetical protein